MNHFVKCLAKALIPLLTLTACQSQIQQGSKVIVESIASGNSLNIVHKQENWAVRICGVEVTKEGEAQKILTELVSKAKKIVILTPIGINDEYQERDIVAEVFVKSPTPDQPEKETSFSEELIIRGLARFAANDNCPNNEAFRAAEQEAKQKRVGIWSSKL